MQICARRELKRGGPRIALPDPVHDFPRMRATRDKTRATCRKGRNEKQACSIHEGLLDVPRKSRKRIARETKGKSQNETGTRSLTTKHMHPVDRSTVGRDPTPWLSVTQPPRDYLNCFVKWINGARRWSRSLLPSPALIDMRENAYKVA